MKLGVPLASAPANRYHPIGVQGQPVFAAHVQLRAALLQRFGPRHAHCFSRPDQDPRDETIRWHAEVPGAARTWTELSAAEQATAALTLEEIRGDLVAYARTLRGQSADGSAHTIALLLEQAVIIPSADHLHLIGDQPVLSFWGFERVKGQGINGLGLVPAAEPAATGATIPSAAPLETPSRRRWSWAWWLGLIPLLLLLLLLFAWLFWGQGCTPSFVTNGGGLPVPVAEPPHQEGAVTPTPPVSGGAILPGAPGAAEFSGTLGPSQGAGTLSGLPSSPIGESKPPAVPSPAPDSAAGAPPPPVPNLPPVPPTVSPVPPAAPPVAKDPLQIPPDALQKGDPSFLAGYWQSRRGVIDEQTGEPLVQRYRFDQRGQGEAIIRRADGSECRAPAQGKISGGKLTMQEQGRIVCPDGRTYSPAETRCERTASGVTVCRGVNSDGSDYRVDLDRVP